MSFFRYHVTVLASCQPRWSVVTPWCHRGLCPGSLDLALCWFRCLAPVIQIGLMLLLSISTGYRVFVKESGQNIFFCRRENSINWLMPRYF